jgi:trehalose/maltose hydrolase-like predicted phosphorylase
MKEPQTMKPTLEPTADLTWLLHVDGYDALRETTVESRFAISNGLLGIRGARAMTRGARWVVPARTYVAGLFDTPGTGSGAPGLVPAADWLQVRILLPGGPLVSHPKDVSSHRITLDMKRGALLSEFHRLKAPGAKHPNFGIHVRTLRLVSLDERAIGLQLIQLEIEEGEGEVTLEASFEGVNLGLVTDRVDQDLGLWRTHPPGSRLAIATASLLQVDGQDLSPSSRGELKNAWTWTCRPAQVVCFERSVAVVRTDTQDRDAGKEARNKLAGARKLGWHGVVAKR